MKSVCMIGVLPPMKGLSYYCYALTQSVTKYLDVEFIAFKKLYPSFLYPHGYEDNGFKMKYNPRLHIKRGITYYNPFSWISAGLCRDKVIHAQLWSPPTVPFLFTAFFVARIFGKKTVVTVHTVEPHEKTWWNRFANKMLFLVTTRIIVHSESNKQKLLELYNFPEKRVDVVPHMLLDIYGHISRSKALKHLKIPRQNKVILCFGIIREYKGIDILLDAFYQVKKNCPNTTLIIAGKPWIDWQPYQSQINALKLNDSIKLFLDFVPDSEIKYLYGAADFTVLPYKKFEAQSSVGNVALSYNTPMIVSNVGGLSDLVKDNRCIVKPGDALGLAKIMVLMLKDRTLISKLIVDSKTIKKQFSLEEVGRKTVEVYEKALMH